MNQQCLCQTALKCPDASPKEWVIQTITIKSQFWGSVSKASWDGSSGKTLEQGNQQDTI